MGWALLRFVWEGGVLGALAAALLWTLRRHGAHLRYAVCCAALGLCAALPAWHVAAALWPADAAAVAGAGASASPWQWPFELELRLPAIVAAWSLGAALMGLRLGAGLVWVARLRSRAGAVPAHWQAALDALAVRLGLRMRIVLQSVDRLAAPVTVGWLRPVVLVPVALLTQMPVPLLEALLAHELAHVARRDYLVNLLQALVEALLFFHPVVWWLSARLRAEREHVADEMAGRAIGDGRRLATALQALALAGAATPAAGWAVSARGGSLLRRIESLLAPRTRASSWRPALVASLVAGASLLAHWNLPRTAFSPADIVARAAAPAAIAPHAAAPAWAPLLALPAVNARHALVLDEATGQVLMAKDADAVVPIASLTKLMTAMVVLDARLAPAEDLRILPADVDTVLHSSSHLAVGARVTRGAALAMALMASDNRAAAALARTYPGGPAAFGLAMQAKIRDLGLVRTTLADPTGVSPGNASSATEMARIVTASARYPEIAAITSERAAEVVVDGHARQLHNTNPLVGDAGWNIRVSKTGFTHAAGNCLTMSLRAGGKDVTLVLLDTADAGQRLRDAAAIQQALARAPAI